MSFDRNSMMKKSEEIDEKYNGSTSKRIECDACGMISSICLDKVSPVKKNKKNDDDSESSDEQKIFCPRCGKLIRTSEKIDQGDISEF